MSPAPGRVPDGVSAGGFLRVKATSKGAHGKCLPKVPIARTGLPHGPGPHHGPGPQSGRGPLTGMAAASWPWCAERNPRSTRCPSSASELLSTPTVV